MNARITRSHGWITTETFEDGKVIGVERCRTRESIERRRAVRAMVVAAVVLVGGLAVMTARAEPVPPCSGWTIEIDLWPFPFYWPQIWVRNIDAGGVG